MNPSFTNKIKTVVFVLFNDMNEVWPFGLGEKCKEIERFTGGIQEWKSELNLREES